jgi:DHA2 family methylenomycin A resistance protein-like MFS transporter
VERFVRAPLLPLELYADRGFAAAAAQGTLLNFAFYGVLFTMSLVLQQGRGLSPLVTGLLFLPLTGLISIANLCSAPLTRRFGRPAVLAIGQAVLTLSLLGLAWASTSSAVWPMVLALVPIGFSSGLLVPTMTAQSIAAVEPDLHGAASAAFNTSRQIGGAIGVATFGPLLGTAHNLTTGFVTCTIVAAAASIAGLCVTVIAAIPRRRPIPVPSAACDS